MTIYKTEDADPTADYDAEVHTITISGGNDQTLIWDSNFTSTPSVQVTPSDGSKNTVSHNSDSTSGIIGTGAGGDIDVDVEAKGET